MLQPAEFPEVTLGTCGLEVECLGEASSLEGAWQWLPPRGQGVVMTADSISRYHPDRRAGLLLSAEVAEGSSTWVVRMDGTTWRGWRWRETEGDTHRFVERHYLSSEPHQGDPPRHVYRQYWGPEEDEGIRVLRPLGQRFCGWKEA